MNNKKKYSELRFRSAKWYSLFVILDMSHSDQFSIDDRLQVYVRIKPNLQLEPGLESDLKAFHVVNNKSIIFNDNGKRGKKPFVFDYVFNENEKQEILYKKTTAALIEDVISGYNAAVFAYGATGTGKTYTMLGEDKHPGLMVQALCDLIDKIKARNKDNTFKTTITYLEIYNEQIRDLLNPTSELLDLREDTKGKNVNVNGAYEVQVNTKSEVLKLLRKGNKQRTIELTTINKASSRSHAVLLINIFNENGAEDENMKKRRKSRLVMIDLAGSEKATFNFQTRAGRKVQKEGSHINRSLLALGNCINAISIGAKFVNFRDSKLTRLLKGTLSGNCKTVMIAHVSLLVQFKDESRTTLSYAERANIIRNKVERNSFETDFHIKQYQDIIRDLNSQIQKLKLRIQKENDSALDEKGTRSVTGKFNQTNFREQIVETFKEQMDLRKKLMDIESNLLSLNIDSEQLKLVISKWEAKNNKVYESQDSRLSSSSLSLQSLLDDNIFNNEFGDFENVQSIWSQLSDIDNEQAKLQKLRELIIDQLSVCKKKSVDLEHKIKKSLTSNDEKEFLKLLCRVYELEVDKISLNSENLVHSHELRRKNLTIFYLEHQRQICEEIILRQREIFEKNEFELTSDLEALYKCYQREIQEAVYVDKSLNANRFFDQQSLDCKKQEETLTKSASSLDVNIEQKSIDRKMRKASIVDDIFGSRVISSNSNLS